MTMSCNIFFYEAVQKIRLDNLAKRSKDLFHGLPTGIDLPNEMKGRVPDRAYMNKLYGTDGWSTGALLNISIGQGEVLVTPIQMIAYVNTIATFGNYNPIYIVKNEGGSAISTSDKSINMEKNKLLHEKCNCRSKWHRKVIRSKNFKPFNLWQNRYS